MPSQLPLLHCGQKIFTVTHVLSDCFADFFIGDMVGEGDAEDSSEASFISTAAIFLYCSSAVRIHDSHAYRKMERTRACRSFILDFSATFLSFKKNFNFVNAVNVCTDLARISVLDPSSLMIAPMYLNYFALSPVLVNWQLYVI